MSQPRYGSSSTLGENLATGAAASAGIAGAGGLAWSAGRRRLLAGERLVDQNKGYPSMQRMADDFDRAERSKRREARRESSVAQRRENLTARTRARLSPLKPGPSGKERYSETGRRGIYPTRRLRAMDQAVDQGRERARAWKQSADQSRADGTTAYRQAQAMKARFEQGTQAAAKGRRLARGGRALTIGGGLSALALGAGAEMSRNRPPRTRTAPARTTPNVVDLGRYRAMTAAPDSRGSILVDAQGNKKLLDARAGANWLKNNGRSS